MTKKQTTIRKIIAAITLVSLLAILAIYAFSSSEKNEDANKNDPQKKIQNGDDKDNIQKDNPPEAHKAGNDGWLSRREAVLGGFLGVALYIWYYSEHLIDIDSGEELWQALCGGVNMFYTAGCWVIASALGLVAVKLVGYLIARYINKALRQSVINAFVLLAPSAILLQIGRLIRQKKPKLAALNKTLMLMSVGVLFGVAIGALTFTIASYYQCYEEVDTADSMWQFLPKLNPTLHKQEMISLGVLSLIVLGGSLIVWKHDVRSWETAAILGATIVRAVLTIQLLHTVATKPPDKCTLVGSLFGLGSLLYFYPARNGFKSAVNDNNQVKSMFVGCCTLGLPILGYLCDTKWSEKIKGKEFWVNSAIGVLSFLDLLLGYKYGGWVAFYIATPVILLALLVIYFNWEEVDSIKKIKKG